MCTLDGKTEQTGTKIILHPFWLQQNRVLAKVQLSSAYFGSESLEQSKRKLFRVVFPLPMNFQREYTTSCSS